MSAKRDYYEVLGIGQDSSAADIKSQYRKLALKFHPDRNNSDDAGEHFKEISEAYAVLSDEKKRRMYDAHGHAGIDEQYSTEDIFRGANFGSSFGDMGSMFERIFGRGGFGQQQQQGRDMVYEIELTLKEVLHGKTIDIDFRKDVECVTCHGTGSRDSSRQQCNECEGSGHVRQSTQSNFSAFIVMQPCRKCSGSGSIITNPCTDCASSGKRSGTHHLSRKIPAGTSEGDYMIEGEGEYVPMGINGDLILRVNIKGHKEFERSGADLICRKNISMTDALLGCKLEIPTIEDTKMVNIPAGTQFGDTLTISGQGLPGSGWHGRGNIYVKLHIDIPKKLTKEQKRLVEEFRNLS